MRLDELARLAQLRGDKRESCPSLDQLRATAELSLPAHERERVLDHVAQCAACRREFDVLRTLVVSHERLQQRNWWTRPIPLAAAAVLFIAIAVSLWQRSEQQTLRGTRSEIQIIAPTADPGANFDRRLVWRPVARNASYSVVLLRDGLPLIRYAGLTDTMVVLADTVRLDPPARIDWYVEAVQGNRRVRSRVQSFTLPAIR